MSGTQRARTLAPPGSAPAQACTDRLDQLAPALAQHGMTTSLLAPDGRVPSLRVVNPSAPALAEDVYAGCCADGSWWFWWSWAERISAASDLNQAASRIARVLAVTD
ncbi:MAG TPA: hypothetical protein VMH35_15870 [Streptosporangiaceae bacterium]|nr:hypothetical protein [Streptosporangiaceae bacterium]